MVDPVVPLAEGVLTQLYGLGSPRRARQLLRAAADRHEVAVRMLAQPIVDTWWRPGPDATVPPLPRAPDLPLTGALATDPGIPGRILVRGLELCGSGCGDVQLVNATTGQLVLVALEGLPAEFATYFAEVDTDGTACAHARHLARRVCVADVAASALFTPASRQAMLEAGSRAVHSTPWIGPDGHCMGMISLHGSRPGAHVTPAEGHALDALAAEAAAWAVWRRAIHVHDALEDLRASAATSAQRPRR
ncbi:hypothetical protein GCM10010302_31420 [Streptomyces polychromogenes]|uniref:GAF domain-containing protein n=2 Tax=Streptomyces TaxID=1883 RepID=A0ABN0VDK1_9ACTN